MLRLSLLRIITHAYAQRFLPYLEGLLRSGVYVRCTSIAMRKDVHNYCRLLRQLPLLHIIMCRTGLFKVQLP